MVPSWCCVGWCCVYPSVLNVPDYACACICLDVLVLWSCCSQGFKEDGEIKPGVTRYYAFDCLKICPHMVTDEDSGICPSSSATAHVRHVCCGHRHLRRRCRTIRLGYSHLLAATRRALRFVRYWHSSVFTGAGGTGMVGSALCS